MIENIIHLNQQISLQRREPNGFVKERLELVFSNVNLFNEIDNKRERIIKKASHLLGGITFHQPFFNANKRTALAITIYFLRKNGFDMVFHTQDEEKEMFELLENTMLKMEGDETIISDVEGYLKRKVITTES